MVKSSELETRSDALANRDFNNVKQSACAAGSLPKASTFSKKISKPESPAEHEYVLGQWSPSSDISFGWQEVPAHPRTASRCSSNESDSVHSSSSFASACTNSSEQISVTTEDRHFNELREGKEEISCGVTATNKVNLREDKETVAKSTHLALKSVVSENLKSRNFRMNETCDSVEGISEVHSEEFSYSQKVTEDNCRKKKTHDVSMREDSGSESSDDSVEVTQSNGTMALSSLNLSVMQLLDLTSNIY
jgi:glutamine synthetase adenylyltransferase